VYWLQNRCSCIASCQGSLVQQTLVDALSAWKDGPLLITYSNGATEKLLLLMLVDGNLLFDLLVGERWFVVVVVVVVVLCMFVSWLGIFPLMSKQ
jgi:hypothetical protein